MAITKSAKKAAKRSVKLGARNLVFKKVMKVKVKNIIKDVTKGVKVSQEALNDAYKAIDKAQKTGVIKKKTASRRKSRVARNFNKQETAK